MLFACIVVPVVIDYQLRAQTPVFENYTVKNGLPVGTVYYALADKKGFMWFGTDRGLSRFDGANFKNYTSQDGLPDNTVLRLKEDSAGRLWMICYNSGVCFMQDGVIHNADNDSLLRNIRPERFYTRNIDVDRQGRIWIMGCDIQVIEGNTIKRYTPPNEKEAVGIGYIKDRFFLVGSAGIYETTYGKEGLHFQLVAPYEKAMHFGTIFWNNQCYVVYQPAGKGNYIMQYDGIKSRTLDLSPLGITHVICNQATFHPIDSILLISSRQAGLYAFSASLDQLPRPYKYLPEVTSFTYTAVDHEGGTWLSTLERGIFYIPRNAPLLYTLENASVSTNITSVFRINDMTLMGSDLSKYGIIRKDKLTVKTIESNSSAGKGIIRQCRLNNAESAIATDFGIVSINNRRPEDYSILHTDYVKNITAEGDDSVLVAAGNMCYRLVKNGKRYKTDTFRTVKSTAVAKDPSGNIWIGSPRGLFVSKHGKVSAFHRNELINKSRISDLFCDEFGNTWVATHQRGVFILTADSIIAVNKAHGLPSDICMRFYKQHKGLVWLCTGNSVAKIVYGKKDGFYFNVSVPLPIDVQVNDLCADNGTLWLATTKGLLAMQTGNYISRIATPVYITSFKTSDSIFRGASNVHLRPGQNNVEIEYIGLSYNYGKVSYKYLLSGSGPDTVYTTNNVVNFSSLSPGNYSLQLWAKSNAGQWSSAPALASFQIDHFFWQTTWFKGLILVLIGVTGLSGFRLRVQQVKKREKEKTALNKRLADIELKAIKAQMNEHFVFNSLNSIQGFINTNNTDAANFYLAHFGRLIRQTLDLSGTPIISINREIEYLKNYLTLEKMRLSEKFDFIIRNEITSLSSDTAFFPSMILQPHVENAVKHGLRHRSDNAGLLTVLFREERGMAICVIEDNGIGRSKAAELKKGINEEHISRGTELTTDRVVIFNQLNNQNVRVQIYDLAAANGTACGTRVVLVVPIKNYDGDSDNS